MTTTRFPQAKREARLGLRTKCLRRVRSLRLSRSSALRPPRSVATPEPLRKLKGQLSKSRWTEVHPLLPYHDIVEWSVKISEASRSWSSIQLDVSALAVGR